MFRIFYPISQTEFSWLSNLSHVEERSILRIPWEFQLSSFETDLLTGSGIWELFKFKNSFLYDSSMKSDETRVPALIFHEDFENTRILILSLRNEKIVFSGRPLIDLRQLCRNPWEKSATYVEKLAMFSSVSVRIFIILVRVAATLQVEKYRALSAGAWSGRSLAVHRRAPKSDSVTSSFHVGASRQAHLRNRIHRSTRCCKELDEEKKISHRK